MTKKQLLKRIERLEEKVDAIINHLDGYFETKKSIEKEFYLEGLYPRLMTKDVIKYTTVFKSNKK